MPGQLHLHQRLNHRQRLNRHQRLPRWHQNLGWVPAQVLVPAPSPSYDSGSSRVARIIKGQKAMRDVSLISSVFGHCSWTKAIPRWA